MWYNYFTSITYLGSWNLLSSTPANQCRASMYLNTAVCTLLLIMALHESNVLSLKTTPWKMFHGTNRKLMGTLLCVVNLNLPESRHGLIQILISPSMEIMWSVPNLVSLLTIYWNAFFHFPNCTNMLFPLDYLLNIKRYPNASLLGSGIINLESWTQLASQSGQWADKINGDILSCQLAKDCFPLPHLDVSILWMQFPLGVVWEAY